MGELLGLIGILLGGGAVFTMIADRFLYRRKHSAEASHLERDADRAAVDTDIAEVDLAAALRKLYKEMLADTETMWKARMDLALQESEAACHVQMDQLRTDLGAQIAELEQRLARGR